MKSAACLLSSIVAAAAPAQGPAGAEPVARYRWRGEERVVTNHALAAEMAQRFGRTPRGEEAVRHLVDLDLVRRAAEAKGYFPTPAEVEARLHDYYAKIREQGHDPDRFLAERNVSAAEFADYTTLTLALDRLVMDALDLDDPAQVTNEFRELWLRDAKKAQPVVVDPAQLADGVVARVGDRLFTRLDLGLVLARRAAPAERRRFKRQVVLRQILDAEALARGIAVTDADLDAAVARIRARASDGRAAVSFDSVLEAMGTTATELRRSPVLRAQVVARRLLMLDDPAAVLRQRLQDDPAAVLAKYGPRRRVEVLLLRATDTDNPLIKRTFADADAEARKLRRGILDGEAFHIVARIHSEDARTKPHGGDSGWHHRAGVGLPEEVLAWAFAAGQGDVSEPIRVREGLCLARVRDIEPDPDAATMLERMLDDLEEELYRDFLERAELRYEEGP